MSRKPLARTICGIKIVLLRKSDRTPFALENACLHRLLPLDLGKMAGDQIVCGYHGMTFDSSGKCVRMPMPSEKPAPGARVRAFPLVERYRLLWVWTGDPDLADAALIPDLHWADDPDWSVEGNHFDLACEYRLVLDNLMDLTHEAFVHITSIGHHTITEAPFTVTNDARTVTLSRWMIGCEAPPFLAMQLRLARGLGPEDVDRWQIISFEAPSTITIDVGVAKTGTGAQQGNRDAGVSGRVLNTVTPQSDGRCYYFFGFARSFHLVDEALTREIRDVTTGIFAEDKIILEEQQRAIDRYPDRPLRNFSIDQGALRVRRILDRLVAEERLVVANKESPVKNSPLIE